MKGPSRSAEEASPRPPQKTLVEFVETLHRIFKIGTYYPEGHAVLDRAAHLFQQNLQKITEAKRSAGIEMMGTALLVEGEEISATSPAVAELTKLLRDLGIGRIEIERVVPLTDLLHFTRALQLYRAQLLGVKQFTQVKITDLPSTIRIIQHEFLVDESAILGESLNTEGGEDLDSVFHLLEDQGLDRQKIAQCRELIHTLARRFENHPMKLKGMPAIRWHDVRKLMVRVVTGVDFGERTGGVSPNDLSALSAIFNGLRQELDDHASRDTIDHLVTAFNRGHSPRTQQTTEEEVNRKRGLRTRGRGTDMTISEIQSFVHDRRPEPSLLKKMAQSRYDELAVLLQLLHFPQGGEAGEGIRRSLREILAAPLAPRMIDLLIKGVVHLTEAGTESGHLRQVVDFISLQLRSSTTGSSLPFLVMLCRQLKPAGIEFLWPTLINELLTVGRQAEQQRLFSELSTIAAGIPGKAMRDRLPELDGIDCIKKRKIAQDIFAPELKKAYPIYAVLMGTSLRLPIASRVLDNLKAAPPDWLIEAVSPLLELAQPHHMQFLYSYLNGAQQQRYSASLLVMAGKLVVERLPILDEPARKEAWVAVTIQATAKIQVEGTRELLEQILAEKKLIIVPKWPSPCRQAAEQTLKILKRNPLG